MSGPAPRVVIGIPMYEPGPPLAEAIESLLAQDFDDYAVVVTDDSRSDEGERLILPYVQRDSRLSYTRNPERLGYLANNRRAFGLAKELHPAAELFAWGSDHDVWHPRWLGSLVEALDRNAGAVMAWPMIARLDDDGRVHQTAAILDTSDLQQPRERLMAATGRMPAGHMVYGLFHTEAIERVDVFPGTLAPDRLFLTELALHGPFVQVPEVLWYRRYKWEVTADRQRESLYPGRPPLSSRLPWSWVHAWVLGRRLVINGKGRPSVGRFAGARLAVTHARRITALYRQRASRLGAGDVG